MFLKVKLIFASVLMYHLWAFRECESAWKIQIYQSQQPNFPKRCRESITFPKKKTVPRTHSISLLKTFFSGSKHVPHHWSRDDDFTSTVTWPWSQEIYELQSTTVKCDFFLRRKWHQRVKHFHFHVIIGKNRM